MNFLHHYDPDDPYPESDGLPMAENTEQYDWLVKIKENLEILFADREDVFIAADLLWYPVADRRLSYPVAPDVMIAFGRPKGKRGSYKQWEEDGIAPQVVFEILSPSNSVPEMNDKRNFYDKNEVQEYYVYDPTFNRLEIWTRQNKHLKKMSHIHGWTSHLLGIRFTLNKQTLRIFYPSGKPFLNSIELSQYAQEAEQLAEVATQRADIEAKNRQEAEQRAEVATQRADIEAKNRRQAEQRAELATQRAARLAEQLRALGFNPDIE